MEQNKGWLPKACVTCLLLIALGPAASASQSAGACYSAYVPGPIVLPDNSVTEAGKLEICFDREYSPVAGFHRASVNGRVAGLFVSRKITKAAPRDKEQPHFVFARLADGKYKLESYGWCDGQTQVTFDLRSEEVRSRWQVRSAKGEVSPDPAEPGGTRVVLLASLRGGR